MKELHEEPHDIRGEGSVKVNCTFCGKEMECPKDMLQRSKKHMCYDCFQNAWELAKGEDMREVHVDIPMDKMDEFIPETMTSSVMEGVFPYVWKERKEELKAMSKKALAKEMFGAGAYVAIQQTLATLKKAELDETNPKKDIA